MSIDVFYRENYYKLLRLAVRLTGNREDAEEVVQESFLNAYKSWNSFKNKSKRFTWLYRITVNCATKYNKKSGKLPVSDSAEKYGIIENQLKADDNVENKVIADEIREYCLQIFINLMPRKQRIAFALKVLLDMPVKEVSEIMNISESSVKVNVFRAKKLMKRNMEVPDTAIDAKNRCNFNNWVNFIIKNGIQYKTAKIRNPGKNDLKIREVVGRELSFITRIRMLYDNSPTGNSFEKFMKKIRYFMINKKLRLLS